MKIRYWTGIALIAAYFCATQGFASGTAADQCSQADQRPGQSKAHPLAALRKQKPLYDDRHPPHAGDEGVFFGPFVKLIDGDTFFARIQGVVMEFRLSDIDAPEHDQPYGARSRDELRSLIGGHQLIIVFVDTDRYGRTVSQVWVNNMNVNHEMARRGAAWFYPQFARDDAVFEIEQQARDAKRGLWGLSSDERIEPWIWRERKRQAGAVRSSAF